jgi:hypothetical protein
MLASSFLMWYGERELIEYQWKYSDPERLQHKEKQEKKGKEGKLHLVFKIIGISLILLKIIVLHILLFSLHEYICEIPKL